MPYVDLSWSKENNSERFLSAMRVLPKLLKTWHEFSFEFPVASEHYIIASFDLYPIIFHYGDSFSRWNGQYNMYIKAEKSRGREYNRQCATAVTHTWIRNFVLFLQIKNRLISLHKLRFLRPKCTCYLKFANVYYKLHLEIETVIQMISGTKVQSLTHKLFIQGPHDYMDIRRTRCYIDCSSLFFIYND